MVRQLRKLHAEPHLRCGIHRLSGCRVARSHRRRAAQPRPGLGGFRLRRAHSASRCASSTTPPCRRLAATRGGRMLFLGLGTGLGVTLIIDGVVEPTELGHMPYKHGPHVSRIILASAAAGSAAIASGARASTRSSRSCRRALEVDYVVLGGGNAAASEEPAAGCASGAITATPSSAACVCGGGAVRGCRFRARCPPRQRALMAAAPGAPGLAPTWCSSAKEMVGCSLGSVAAVVHHRRRHRQ